MPPTLQQELARAATDVAKGAGQLLDQRSDNNIEGVGNVVAGVARAARVTGDELDRHLKAAGLSLPQLSLPPRPEELLTKAVQNGVKMAMDHLNDPEVKKREQEEAERKAKEEALAKQKEAERQKQMAEAEAKEAHSRRDTDRNESKRMKAWDETTVSSEQNPEHLRRDPQHYQSNHEQPIDGSYNELRDRRQQVGGVQGPGIDNMIMGQGRSPEQIHQENEALRQHREDSRPALVKGDAQQEQQKEEDGRADKERRRRPQNYLV